MTKGVCMPFKGHSLNKKKKSIQRKRRKKNNAELNGSTL
jgi:hypothetical protein